MLSPEAGVGRAFDKWLLTFWTVDKAWAGGRGGGSLRGGMEGTNRPQGGTAREPFRLHVDTGQGHEETYAVTQGSPCPGAGQGREGFWKAEGGWVRQGSLKRGRAGTTGVLPPLTSRSHSSWGG